MDRGICGIFKNKKEGEQGHREIRYFPDSLMYKN